MLDLRAWSPILLLVLIPALGCGDSPTAPPDIEIGTFEAEATGLFERSLTGDATVSSGRIWSIDGGEYPGDDLSFHAEDHESGLIFLFRVSWIDKPRLGKGTYRCTIALSPDPAYKGLVGYMRLTSREGEYGHFFTPSCEVTVERKTKDEVYGRFHMRAKGFLPLPGDNQFANLWVRGSFRAFAGDLSRVKGG